jgi:DMSO/TMAO reductase YedYZ molybdopterin-dependent catalytic subunit
MNNKLHRILTIIITVLVLSFAVIIYAGCGNTEDDNVNRSGNTDNKEAKTVRQLAPVQVDEYEGKDLSSIEDFRENSIKGPQYIDISGYTLEVDGLVNEGQIYSYDEVLEQDHYKKVVDLHCVEGWSVKILWEGIKVKDLLEASGIREGANTVIFHAEDGYTTSLPLDYILENDILMAYKMNDVDLPAERGYPFQLVAEAKLGYKWIKWITRIELSDNENYRGFWEKRGYSNEADIDG